MNKRIERSCERDTREWLWITIVFLAFFAVLVAITNYPRFMRVYPDELRYLHVARSLAHGQGLVIRSSPSSFQKILYPLLIAPAMLLPTTGMQIMAVGWINCFLAASTVFPAYLLSKMLSLGRRARIFFMICTVTFPTMAACASFMSEISFLPLTLWTVCLFLRLFDEDSPRKCLVLNLLAGFACWIAYLNKEIALYFVLAYFGTQLLFLRQDRCSVRQMLGQSACFLLGFLAPFVLFKLTLFRGMGATYHQTSMLDAPHMLYMCYAILYYLVLSLPAFGLLPVFLVLLDAVSNSRQGIAFRKLEIFLLLSFLISIGVVGFAVTAREEYLSWAPRLHLRYFEPLLLPFLAVSLPVFTSKLSNTQKRVLVMMITAWAILFLCIGGRVQGTHCDNTLLRWMEFLTDKLAEHASVSSAVLLLKMGSVAIVLACLIAFFKCGSKAVPFLGALLVMINVFSLWRELKSNYWVYRLEPAEAAELSSLNDLLHALDGNILVIPNLVNDFDSLIIDTYIDRPVYLCEAKTMYDRGILDDGVVDFQKEAVYPSYFAGPYPELDRVSYILSSEGVTFEDASAVLIQDEPLSGYKLYEVLTPASVRIKEYIPPQQ